MTVKSGFFSNGASYNQADFNAFLLDSIGSGYVLGYGNELRVSANSPANMGVLVRTGRCYVQGYYGWVTANEALTVPTANPTKPRIDRVVARLSVSVNQSVTFAVLTGTPATTPTPPALTRTSETYEISLARIFVGAGVTSINAANITDERADATVCGVAGVKHSWSYLNNVVIDVSGMTVDAGVSNRSPVYFNGTKWVVATSGAIGFYDKPNAAVITAGYLDGFTGLTPGAIVGNRGVALTATKIVVLESPINNSGVKQVGAITGTLTGSASKFSGDTPAEYAAKLKCVIHSNQPSTDYYTYYTTNTNPLLFPAPLKSNTSVSVYGSVDSNSVAYIDATGLHTILLSWATVGARDVTIPAGAIGIIGKSAGGVYLNMYFTFTV